MILGGFLPVTLLDYPGQVACIVFTQGCNLRCFYCHNPQLIPHQPPPCHAPTDSWILEFLKARKGRLDGIVVSGGEPTLQPNLLPFLQRIKNLGFLVKLDTNGTHPGVLQEALRRKLLDYVALDVKHDPLRYSEVTQVDVDPDLLAVSRDLLLSSDIPYEFRTTVVPELHDEAVMERIAAFCKGAARLVLQPLRRPTRTPSPRYQVPFSFPNQLQRFQQIAAPFVAQVHIAPDPSQPHSILPNRIVS